MPKNNSLAIAAAYIRVSTDNQTELSPDSQIKVIRQYAKQNGYIVPNEFIFRDDGISGKYASKRPQFNQMIAVAKQKPAPFSAVLLWKFSRFARNQEESIFYKSMLRKNGVDVLSVSEPVIEGPFGSLIERIIEWTDEYYSIRLSGEVKRGMLEKVERGGIVSVASFGYVVKDNQYVINPETAPIVQKIYRDFLDGVSLIQIARQLNDLGIKTTRGGLWENRTVDYILQNPVYIGKIRWNPKRRTRRNFDDEDIIIVDGTHEPIIDTDTYNKVQEKREQLRKAHKRYTHEITDVYMLHGLVKCSNCGASLCAAVKGKSLQCIKYTHGKCNKSHSIVIEALNKMVITAIEQAFSTGCFNLTVKDKKAVEQIDVSSLIEKEQTKLKRIKEAYENGVYTLEEFKQSKEIVESQITRLLEQKPVTNEISAKEKLVERHKDCITQLKNPNVSEAEKNKILHSFIDKIVFDRTNSSIEIFFYS